MQRLLLPIFLLAASMLAGCAGSDATTEPAPTQTVTVTASSKPSPTAEVGNETAFLQDVRMKARTLTKDLVADETLVSLGGKACGEEDGQIHRLNAELNQGFTKAEVEVVFAAGKRHLCG